jgi:3-phosphoinositide dependent protein kinase-1
LKHPSIIKFYSTFQDKYKLYFLLEHMPNGSLYDFLKRERIVNLRLAKHFTAEILQALEILRKNQIVHRDLKPGNILLDKNYHIKLIDFATCKVFDPKLIEKIPPKVSKNSAGRKNSQNHDSINSSC